MLLVIVSLPSPIKSLLLASMNDADVTWWLLLLCISSSLMSSLPNASKVSDDPGGLDITGRAGLLILLLRGGGCRCVACCFTASVDWRCRFSFILDAFMNIRPSNGGTMNASSTASIQTVILPTFLKYRKWYFPGIGKSYEIAKIQKRYFMLDARIFKHFSETFCICYLSYLAESRWQQITNAKNVRMGLLITVLRN